MTHPDYPKQVRHVFSITLVLNLTVALAKIVLGSVTGALAITADGVHSLTDAAGNIAGLIGLRAAHRPPDHNHPYGHARYETIAALTIGLLLLVTAWEILTSIIDRFHQGVPEFTLMTWAVLIGTLVINVFVSRYQRYHGQRLNSVALLADAKNTQADVWVTLSVIISTVMIAVTGWGWVDIVTALVVVFLIVRAAWSIVQQTASVLVDTAPYSADEIIPLISHVSQIHSIKRVRTRGTTDAAFIDVDVSVAAYLTVGETQQITSEIRSSLEAALNGVEEIEVHYAAFP